jgi:hypothetical protein
VIRALLDTRLWEACWSPLAKKVQGTRAQNAKMGYGTPSEGTRASRPRKTVKTTMIVIGWIIAQDAPMAVCL